MRYSPEIIAAAKRMFVVEHLSPNAISRHFGGNPVPQTIHNWANGIGADGTNWFELRKERAEAIFEAAMPENLAMRILREINRVLESPEIDTKKADALKKYVSAFRELVEPSHQVQMIYHTLTEFVAFLKARHEDLVTPALIESMREFKDEQRRRLGV